MRAIISFSWGRNDTPLVCSPSRSVESSISTKFVSMFPGFCFLLVLHQEVDVVKTVHQAMLLVAVDVEVLRVACGFVGDRLPGQIHLDLGLRVVLDALEEFSKEYLAHLDREHEVIELVVLMDIGKERRDDHSEAIAGNSPGGMFAAGARAEILAGHQYAARVGRVVEYEVLVHAAVSLVAPVAEKVVAEEALLAGGSLQKSGGDNLVGVHILDGKWHTGAGYDVELLFHNSSRGSVITPVTAAAAAVSGLASMVREPGP